MLVVIVVVASLFAGAAYAQMGITFFPGPGMTATAAACSPGNPTGQMDFSVCSNVGITAAVMP
jgi:hypothetical protein